MGLLESKPKWTNDDPEPKYEDGTPERIDFKNCNGLNIVAFQWKRKENSTFKGKVLLVHGIDGHCRWEYLCHSEVVGEKELKYFPARYEGSLVELLNNQGYDVYGLDHQSYGLSEGKDNVRGYFEHFDDLCVDVLQFRKEIIGVQEPADASVYILGSSLGGCVAIRTCELDTENLFTGGLFLAPMMSIEQVKRKPINKMLLPISDVISSYMPTLKVAAKQANLHFPGEEKEARKDPLTIFEPIRARVAVECLNGVERARESINTLTQPFIVVHSTKDTMCDYHGSTFVHENAASKDKDLKLLGEGAWHSIHHELLQQEVKDYVVEFLNAH